MPFSENTPPGRQGFVNLLSGRGDIALPAHIVLALTPHSMIPGLALPFHMSIQCRRLSGICKHLATRG